MRPGLAVFTRGMLHSTKYKYKRKGGSGHHYKSLRSKNMSYMGFHVTGEKKANQWKGKHSTEDTPSEWLNGNKIGNKGGMAFAQVMQIKTTLESLDIGDADLSDDRVSYRLGHCSEREPDSDSSQR
ncbi:hypothetical protein RRG08_040668 [Elysia crispata]|uniref:Uncharacterized protein n=1 Tax=Elysia crispata TaxID=231223 RepID=A0AAE0YXN8_9GAST|nr:hypothetical protein RRG08_040668 [Elysia crispata]